MLSEAKHLLFLLEDKQKQIPRCARDDIVEAFFGSLLKTTLGQFARSRRWEYKVAIGCSAPLHRREIIHATCVRGRL